MPARPLRIASLTLALVLLAACAGSHLPDADGSVPDAGPGSFRGAYLTPECAPDDGVAYRLLLWNVAVPECSADPSARSLSFYFYEGSSSFLPIEAPETITSSGTVGGSGNNGTATDCPGGTAPCRTSQVWSLTFDTFDVGAGASGTYEVRFLGGEILRGSFDASHCSPFPPICG